MDRGCPRRGAHGQALGFPGRMATPTATGRMPIQDWQRHADGGDLDGAQGGNLFTIWTEVPRPGARLRQRRSGTAGFANASSWTGFGAQRQVGRGRQGGLPQHAGVEADQPVRCRSSRASTTRCSSRSPATPAGNRPPISPAERSGPARAHGQRHLQGAPAGESPATTSSACRARRAAESTTHRRRVAHRALRDRDGRRQLIDRTRPGACPGRAEPGRRAGGRSSARRQNRDAGRGSERRSSRATKDARKGSSSGARPAAGTATGRPG